VNRSRDRCDKLLETVRILIEKGDADPALQTSNQKTASEAFESFFDWPSRILPRRQMQNAVIWIRNTTPLELKSETSTPEGQRKSNNFNGVIVDAEVEVLDTLLTPGKDVNEAFSPQRCPISHVNGWTGLHVLMHLRIEPAWHPWSIQEIYRQGSLWSKAMCQMIQQGIDPHALDWQGNTPTRLALRSLYTFQLWQNAIIEHTDEPESFVCGELAECPELHFDGWDQQSLGILFQFRTENLYLIGNAWRERAELLQSADGQNDGLYLRCCWFQLLDILKNQSILPNGWEIVTRPRQFLKPRESLYWHKQTGIMQVERPPEETHIDLSLLRVPGRCGKDLAGELCKMGVIWQRPP
jgi:hypothetical protein